MLYPPYTVSASYLAPVYRGAYFCEKNYMCIPEFADGHKHVETHVLPKVWVARDLVKTCALYVL